MQKKLFDIEELTRLRGLLSYPCADVRENTETRILQKYGKSVLDSIYRAYAPAQVLTKEKPKVIVPELKVPKNWDITHVGLNAFKIGSVSTCPLENIFYGTHNLRIPTQVLDVLNAGEIMAIHYGAGEVKRRNYHQQGSVPRGHLYDLIHHLNDVAFGNPLFRVGYHRFKKRFKNEERPLDQRLSKVSGQEKSKFFRSFFSDYRPSKREEPNNPEAFYDPSSWEFYVDFIYRHFQGRYKREHGK